VRNRQVAAVLVGEQGLKDTKDLVPGRGRMVCLVSSCAGRETPGLQNRKPISLRHSLAELISKSNANLEES